MDPTIEVLHLVLAYLAAGAVVAGVGWSAGLALLDGAGGPNFDRFQAGIVSVFVVAAASGGVLLALGARPSDDVHLLYAAVAVALIPLARSFFGRAVGRRAAVLLVVVFIVEGGVLVRLFGTG